MNTNYSKCSAQLTTSLHKNGDHQSAAVLHRSSGMNESKRRRGATGSGSVPDKKVCVSNANMPHIQTLISKYHGPRTKDITNHQPHEVLHPSSDGHALDKSIQIERRVDSARVGAALVLMSTLQKIMFHLQRMRFLISGRWVQSTRRKQRILESWNSTWFLKIIVIDFHDSLLHEIPAEDFTHL